MKDPSGPCGAAGRIGAAPNLSRCANAIKLGAFDTAIATPIITAALGATRAIGARPEKLPTLRRYRALLCSL